MMSMNELCSWIFWAFAAPTCANYHGWIIARRIPNGKMDSGYAHEKGCAPSRNGHSARPEDTRKEACESRFQRRNSWKTGSFGADIEEILSNGYSYSQVDDC